MAGLGGRGLRPPGLRGSAASGVGGREGLVLDAQTEPVSQKKINIFQILILTLKKVTSFDPIGLGIADSADSSFSENISLW